MCIIYLVLIIWTISIFSIIGLILSVVLKTSFVLKTQIKFLILTIISCILFLLTNVYIGYIFNLPISYEDVIMESIVLSEFESMPDNTNKYVIIDNSDKYPKMVLLSKDNQQLYFPLNMCRFYNTEGIDGYLLIVDTYLYRGNIQFTKINTEYRIFLPNKNKYIVLYKESALS